MSMIDWPIPKSLKALRGFLGLTGYYRKFIKDYGSIAAPLTVLLKKNAFHWTEEASQAFQHLKRVVTSPPVLKLPDFSKSFTIECDASGFGLGAVLMQDNQPIAFYSKALKGKALLLSTYEKELLALVSAVAKWRPYLLGVVFKIKTDQQALKYLLEQRVGTETQQKWLLKLIGYDFTIDYKRGKENKVADALSRKSEEQSATLALTTFPTSLWVEELKQSYQLYPIIQDIYEKLQQGSEGPKHFTLQQGLLLRKWKFVVVSDSPFKAKIHQVWTFFSLAHPYSASKVAQVFFSGVFKLHGLPKSIVSDCDAIFTSNFLNELFKLQGTSLNFSSAYHPQSDGQIEALNKTLEGYLRCYTSDKPKEWSLWIPLVEWCYNTTCHSSIRICPFEALYGYLPPKLVSYIAGTSVNPAVDQQLKTREQFWLMLRENLLKSQNRMKEFPDRKRTEREFQVLERVGTVAYRLNFPPSTKIHPVGQVQPEPEVILQRRMKRIRNHAVTEVLVKWLGAPIEDSTWELLWTLRDRYPHLVGKVL
ncbi:hypothetical protein F2P56_019708 [Juglans regia]|uniref:Uncharacterized protein LOC108990154 n=2 Tax=Juglans regia TaxID=51240 RepID=A0A2I4EJK7_JUGRE|nr:uncharacterized protein LOC108990154 [Juglans regia]KAF5459790.1 hypothetical protein F2P56_019708 [Juglans regia]